MSSDSAKTDSLFVDILIDDSPDSSVTIPNGTENIIDLSDIVADSAGLVETILHADDGQEFESNEEIDSVIDSSVIAASDGSSIIDDIAVADNR